MKHTESIHVTGLSPFGEQIALLAQHNPDYDLTQKEMEDKGLAGERIYQDLYPCEDASLAPEAETGLVQVLVTGQQIGYVRKASSAHVKDLLDKGSVTGVSVKMHGGPYRILMEGDDDAFSIEEGSAALFAMLDITYEEAEKAPAPAGDDSGMHYISTTYDTQTLDDSGRRGNAPLIFAILFSGFYLGFSIPYWILIRKGMASPVARLGGDIANELLNPHMAMVCGALLITLIALVTKNSLLPLAAALLFTGSCWQLPGMTVFTAVPALFCLLSAFRRRSKVLMTLLKVLVMLAVFAGIGWLLKDTALEVYHDHAYVLRPAGTETFDFESGSSDEDYFDDEDFMDYDDDYDDLDDEDYEDFDDEDYADDNDDDYYEYYDDDEDDGAIELDIDLDD